MSAITTCPACNGSGKCTKCEGVGYLTRASRGNDGATASWLPCPMCKNGKCLSCGGKGQVERESQSQSS